MGAQSVHKIRLLTEITAGPATPRHREIELEDVKTTCDVVEVCTNGKIILGCGNGQIRIHDSADVDLQCETVLNYCMSQSWVTCLQCTDTQVLAGYSDGNICAWDIAKGILVHTLSVVNEGCDNNYAKCMRWRDPKLVVGTADGRVKIWQYYINGGTFTLLGSWMWEQGHLGIGYVDFNDNYIILKSFFGSLDDVSVHCFNGREVRTISSPSEMECFAVHENFLITGGEDKVIRFRDILNGWCLHKLDGHEDAISGIDARDDVIASGDRGGVVIIWNAKVVLESRQAKPASFTIDPRELIQGSLFFDIKLGPSFVVTRSLNSRSDKKIVVTDFPS